MLLSVEGQQGVLTVGAEEELGTGEEALATASLELLDRLAGEGLVHGDVVELEQLKKDLDFLQNLNIQGYYCP